MSTGLRRVTEFLPTYCVAQLNAHRLFLTAPLNFAGRELMRRVAWHYLWPSGAPSDRLPEVLPPDVSCGMIVDPLGYDTAAVTTALHRPWGEDTRFRGLARIARTSLAALELRSPALP